MGLMKSKNGLFVLQMQPLQSLQPTCLICPSTQCKASRITAILKIAQLATCQDYRPISITPMEKELVRSFPYSILLSWYSVKYSVTSLLLGQLAPLNLPSFIFCIRSQVFSGIMNMFTALPWTSQMFRHHSLISKICTYAVPDYFQNWLVDCLSSRTHQTTISENKSTFLSIDVNIIQSSGHRPVCYIFNSAVIFILPTPEIWKNTPTTRVFPGTNSSLIPMNSTTSPNGPVLITSNWIQISRMKW